MVYVALSPQLWGGQAAGYARAPLTFHLTRTPRTSRCSAELSRLEANWFQARSIRLVPQLLFLGNGQ